MKPRYPLFLLFIVQVVVASAQGILPKSGRQAIPRTLLVPEHVPEDINWDDRFGPAGTDGEVTAVAVSGDDVFVAGQFYRAGGIANLGLARWNLRSRKWYRVGSDSDMINGTVLAIAVVGSNIYIGGHFTRIGALEVYNLAIFDMASGVWSKWTDGAGGGIFGGSVSTILEVGGKLYVGGQFTAIGTILANNIAYWDGSRFHRLGTGVSDGVSTILSYGSDIYVGGNFAMAGSVPAAHVARWNGSEWSALGYGTSGPVRALAVDGGYLYIGGRFDSAAGLRVNNIARYNLAAGAWSGMEGGVLQIVPDPRHPPIVYAIQPVQGRIYIAGDFQLAGAGDIVGNVAVWDGTNLRGLRNMAGDPNARGVGNTGAHVNVMVLADGQLYIGGIFDAVYGQARYSDDPSNAKSMPVFVYNIVRWGLSDNSWHPLGTSPDNVLTDVAINGDDIYFSGMFHSIGGISSSRVASWNSRADQWSDLGFDLDTVPKKLIAYKGQLYAVIDSRLFLLDRTDDSWKAQGDAVPGSDMWAFAVGSSGIYAGSPLGIFRLGTSGWELIDTLAIQLPDPSPSHPSVSAMTLDGDRLYIAGIFTSVGGTKARNVASLDLKSHQWRDIGENGPGDGYDSQIRVLKADGGRVFAGGDFVYDQSGTRPFNYIAEWDSSSDSWNTMGEGMNAPVASLDLHDGMLYAAGAFTLAGDAGASHVAAWDGEVWSTLGSGVDANATGVAAGENQVIVVGSFQQAGWKPSYEIGRWSDPTLLAPEIGPVTGLAAEGPCRMRVVPNPVSTVATLGFNFPLPDAPIVLTLYDACGKIVHISGEGNQRAGAQSLRIEVTGLASGIYYCKLQQGDRVVTQPIVVAR